MSWLSRALGLDKKPSTLAAINAVGSAALTAVEANNPGLANTISTVTTVASDLGQVHTVSQVVAVVLELDAPGVAAFEQKTEAAFNKILAARGVALLVEGELDAAFEGIVASAESPAALESAAPAEFPRIGNDGQVAS